MFYSEVFEIKENNQPASHLDPTESQLWAGEITGKPRNNIFPSHLKFSGTYSGISSSAPCTTLWENRVLVICPLLPWRKKALEGIMMTHEEVGLKSWCSDPSLRIL